MNTSEQVKAAIEKLYRVFASYTFDDLEPDRHKDIKPLLSQSPRLVPLDVLDGYLTTLMAIYGDGGKNFRHFLPRICECYESLDSQESPCNSIHVEFGEFICSHLHRIGWYQWPPNEVNAIKQFILSKWIQLISTEPNWQCIKKGTIKNISGLDWAGVSLRHCYFIEDIKYLQHPIMNELFEVWDLAIQKRPTIAPVANLAIAYINKNEYELERLESWFHHPDRSKALHQAWIDHQNVEPQSSFFSDAHHHAKLICSESID